MRPLRKLFIDGIWHDGVGRAEVLDPATARPVADLALADDALILATAEGMGRAQPLWAATPAPERAALLRRVAQLLRDRRDEIAGVITDEQGKPLAEAQLEVLASAGAIDWIAEETRRISGTVVDTGPLSHRALVLRQPVGPVAAFTPWNFPLHQAARKLASALGAGCTVVLKASEETPGAAVELVRAFHDAGAPNGAVNLLFGDPAQISTRLIAHPVIAKLSFTGSTPVGRLLGGMAGERLKPATLELGGHAPVIIDADADLEAALDLLVPSKLRNAGQICISPTRFLVHATLHDAFVAGVRARARACVMGPGRDAATTMGPLANPRRLAALQALLDDARSKGAIVEQLAQPPQAAGWFFPPWLLTEVTPEMHVMSEEPFGPLFPVQRFATLDEAIAEANRLDFGLAAYGFARSARAVHRMGQEIRAGMIAVNHLNIATPELPFGGIGASGHGVECGPDALAPYLTTKSFTADLSR